jgi:hypothetical protein
MKQLVEEFARYAAEDLNESLGLAPGYDQTKGNRCDRLTLQVAQALGQRGILLRRELHMDANEQWHYVLAHQRPDAEPTEDDLLSSLNPWQWRSYGGGILHMPRAEMQETLVQAGAPESFVALHSLGTIVRPHDMRAHPFVKTDA